MSDPLSPATTEEALAWFQKEHKSRSQDWTAYCLKDSRLARRVPSMYLTAWAAWEGADDDAKHHVDNYSGFDDVPVGALLITKGSNPAGHIYTAAFAFPDLSPAAWSNDLVRTGYIDKVHRDGPTHWGHAAIGWMTEVNGYDLRLGTKKPPKPKQDKQYAMIGIAIQKMERALDRARREHDMHDIQLFNAEIHRLKHLYEVTKHG